MRDKIEPSTGVDQTMTEQPATAMVDLLTTGAFDDLPPAYFPELSSSRMGSGADIELSRMLVEELLRRGLARDSTDGVSVPWHPIVRTTVLVLLGQLARVAANDGSSLHPVTNIHPDAHILWNEESATTLNGLFHDIALPDDAEELAARIARLIWALTEASHDLSMTAMAPCRGRHRPEIDESTELA